MNFYANNKYDEERALYGLKGANVSQCIFDGPADGESALKECEDIVVEDCRFNLRYPLWHVNKAVIRNCTLTENCRAALWYDDNVTVENSKLHGIKAFRECTNINIKDCDVISPEFLWRCQNITVRDTVFDSQYLFFECSEIDIERMNMNGKYSFQYVVNMTIKDSVLDTKDAFWHSKNVTITDSIVKGEYLGWYSENLKLIRCRIIGTQPLCYCKGLVLEECTMEGTDLSFERSEVNADIRGHIDSVKNPLRGRICANDIGEIILEREYINPDETQIIME